MGEGVGELGRALRQSACRVATGGGLHGVDTKFVFTTVPRPKCPARAMVTEMVQRWSKRSGSEWRQIGRGGKTTCATLHLPRHHLLLRCPSYRRRRTCAIRLARRRAEHNDPSYARAKPITVVQKTALSGVGISVVGVVFAMVAAKAAGGEMVRLCFRGDGAGEY